MLSVSNTGVEAGEWFDRLPTEADRRMVTGVVAMAYEFDLAGRRGYEYGSRYSNVAGYLGVYAIGSRSLAQEGPESDIDLLVAHNLSFGSGCDGRRINYMRNVDFDKMRLDDDRDWSDPEAVQERIDSGYEAAATLENNFGWHCLQSDPVANASSYAIAGAGTRYRLPHSFDGQLPNTYRVGGRDHKAFVRYKLDSDMTALDAVYYKGWHSDANPTDEEIEADRVLAESLGDGGPGLQRTICGPKCREAGLSEGPNQSIFESIIDTDNNGAELPRIPLYTFGDGTKKIYIPQIKDLVVGEQLKVDSRDGWKFKRSWQIHTY